MATSPYGHPMGQQMPDGTWQPSLSERFAVKLPFAFDDTDAKALLTLQKRALIEKMFWEVTTAFEGPGAFAVSGREPPPETPPAPEDPPGPPPPTGTLLGTADATVLSVVGVQAGTEGPQLATTLALIEPGGTIVLDVVTEGFTAGAGVLHVIGSVVG